ncbi:MAG: hypothetical protein ACI4UV_04325 [Victivallales bacterium]
MKLILCVCCICFTVIAWSAENLIGNPDFEIDLATGLPKIWLSSKGTYSEITKEGEQKALRIWGTKANVKYWCFQFVNKIAEGKHYRLTGRVKGTAGTEATVYIECNNPWKTISSGRIICTGEWQEVSFPVVFEKLHAAPYLVLRVIAPGKAMFSNLKLMETVETSVNLIRNSSFSIMGKNDLPQDWILSKGASGKRVSDAGSKYQLQLIGCNAGKNVYFTQVNIPVKTETEYLLKLKFKGTKDALFGVYLESNNPWQSVASPMMKCTGEWQDLSWSFKFRSYRNLPYLVFRLKGIGKVVFCDPELVIEGKGLTNGDFSSREKGWNIHSGKIIDTQTARGKLLELSSVTENAFARQSGISVRRGQTYQIRYEVRGGSDRTYRDSQGAVWFRVIPMAGGKMIPGTERWHDAFDAWQVKTVTFKAEKDAVIDLLCEAKTPGCVWFDNITFEKVKDLSSSLEFFLNSPFTFRNGVYSVNRNEKYFSGKIVVHSISQEQNVILTFQGKDYPLKKSNGIYPFTLETPSQYGNYPISVQILDDRGKVIVKEQHSFQVNAPAEREVFFREDHVMLIDGEPFFPLGVWGVHGEKTTLEKAMILAEAGFNTARCPADQIDDFAAAGLMTLMKIPESLPKFNDKAHFERWNAIYRKEIQKYLKHPSLIGYCNSDEPAWRGVVYGPLVEAYEYIRKLDPYRPVVLNEAPRGEISELRPYTMACDVYGVDIYPIPSPNPHSGLDDKTMTSVGRYVDICRNVVYDRKPVWMTLQGFAWGMVTHKKPFIYPTHAENRFMAYNAVAHGATGLFWWGINWNGYENWDFVRELGKTVCELRAMAPVFVSQTISPAKLLTRNSELHILQKRHDNKNWYIVLNETPKTFTAEFKVTGAEKLKVFFESRELVSPDGNFSDEFAPYAVHIYSEAEKLPSPLKQPVTKRMFGGPFISTDDFKKASWIWYPGKNQVENHHAYFKYDFELEEIPAKVELFMTADDFFQASINGKTVMEHYIRRKHDTVSVRNITEFLSLGRNSLWIKAGDSGIAPCGLLYALRITEKNGKIRQIFSDEHTLASENNRDWVNAEVIGAYGCKPWLSFAVGKPAETDTIGAFGFPF